MKELERDAQEIPKLTFKEKLSKFSRSLLKSLKKQLVGRRKSRNSKRNSQLELNQITFLSRPRSAPCSHNRETKLEISTKNWKKIGNLEEKLEEKKKNMYPTLEMVTPLLKKEEVALSATIPFSQKNIQNLKETDGNFLKIIYKSF